MKKMTRNSNALMRDEFVLAESDLADFLSGSTDSAINFSGSADLHTPIHPPHIMFCRTIIQGVAQVENFPPQAPWGNNVSVTSRLLTKGICQPCS